MNQFLVIQMARFGDLVQTKRLILSLQMRGQVHLCIDESLIGVAAMIYPQSIIHSLPVHAKPTGDTLTKIDKTMQALSEVKFDGVYNLNFAGINRALVRLFAPEQIHGYAMHDDQPLRSSWIRKAFRWTQQRQYAPINLVDFWAWFDDAPCAPHLVNPVARGQGKGVGVVLAGRESRRSLPPDVLAQVVRAAFEALGAPAVYLLGSQAERTMARQLLRLLPGNMLDNTQDLSGKTSWNDLQDVLTGLDLVLTPDTGTMHLAAHLGVPVHAFFLSSAWCHETGPYGVGHTVWQSVNQCAPCLESSSCPINTLCLDDFRHVSLLRALVAKLQQSQSVLQNKKLILPEGLSCQDSYVDTLGTAWKVCLGYDPHAIARWELRAVVADHVGVPFEDGPHCLNAQAQMFYDEVDWILPDMKRHVTEV